MKPSIPSHASLSSRNTGVTTLPARSMAPFEQQTKQVGTEIKCYAGTHSCKALAFTDSVLLAEYLVCKEKHSHYPGAERSCHENLEREQVV